MTRTEKAIAGSFGPVPVEFQHTPANSKPTPPTTSSLTPSEQDRYTLWTQQREKGSIASGTMANVSPALKTAMDAFEAYLSSPSYSQWSFADKGTREFQWRMFNVDVAEANQAAGTTSPTRNAGFGNNPISPVIPISPDDPTGGGGGGTVVTDSDAGGWISDALQYNIICKEIPTGLINGSNKQFTLANNPAQGTDHVFLNGVLQVGTYTITGATINFALAPAVSNTVVVTYIKASTTVPWTAFTYTQTTGGSPKSLDWEQTVNLATDGSNLRWVNNVTTGAASLWSLAAGTTAASSSVVRPLDYNASTNAKVWKRVLGL
jgi:hypothetical protein